MRLPFQLPFLKIEKKEYFLSIVIRNDKVSAVIFEESSGKVRIVSEQEEHFKDSIESTSLEELLEVFDNAISKAEDKLSHPLDKPKTIFGVKENWVLQSRIKKEYLAKLKKISETLGLEPIGFIVIPEAITHLLSKEEGAPVSALLIEIGRTRLSLSLIRAGKIIEIKEASIGESIAHTTDLLLHHFTEYEILPSRILLFDGEKDNLVQEFIGHTWNKNLPFLHVPQVQSLPKRFDARAVLFGAATQMGFEFLQEDEKNDNGDVIDTQNKKDQEISKEEKITEEITSEDKIFVDNFGFIKEVDVASTLTKESLTKKTPLIENVEKSLEENVYQEEKIEQSKKKIFLPKQIFSSLSSFISLFPLQGLRNLFINALSKKRKKILFIPPFIIASILIIFIIYILNLKATVTLKFNPKTIEQSQNIKLSIDEPSDFSRNIIALETISVSEDGTTTTMSTGTKEVGNQAKGTVTIYSSLSNSQTFSKGIVITSLNGLKFTLDNDVKVSSSSGVSDVQTVKVPVTAVNIGKEYNLPSGTKFSMNSFDTSNVEVKNDNAFAGGSKKEITVVSKKDRETLVAKVPEDLATKAKSDILQKIPNDKLLLPIELRSQIDTTEFDQNIGDEAKSVTLKAKVSYKGYLYNKEDFERFSKSLIKNKFRSMIIAKNGISFSLTDTKGDEKTINTVLHLKALLLPEINTQNLAKQITGTSFEEAKAILSKLPQSLSSDINLHPSLPFMPNILPRFTKNITILVSIDE